MQTFKRLRWFHRIRHNAKSAEKRKTSFPTKESVEHVDLYKPVLNKIMPTHQ